MIGWQEGTDKVSLAKILIKDLMDFTANVTLTHLGLLMNKIVPGLVPVNCLSFFFQIFLWV